MTPEELKKKIDGLMFGLHSTNPGDINALPEILNELTEQTEELQGKTPKFVILTRPPEEDMTTKDQLADIGLTEENLKAIASGRVAYIKTASEYLAPIEFIRMEGANAFSLKYRDEHLGVMYEIGISGGGASVSVSPIPSYNPNVKLSALPTADITSLGGLEAIGLTRINLRDIALGKKCSIHYNEDFYQILSATFSGGVLTPVSGTLKFARFYIDNSAMAGVEYDIVFNEVPSQPTTVTVKQL